MLCVCAPWAPLASYIKKVVAIPPQYRERTRRLKIEIDTVMILLEHGGCITEHGEQCLKDFLSGLGCFARRRRDYEAAVNDIIKRFRDPPRLRRA